MLPKRSVPAATTWAAPPACSVTAPPNTLPPLPSVMPLVAVKLLVVSTLMAVAVLWEMLPPLLIASACASTSPRIRLPWLDSFTVPPFRATLPPNWFCGLSRVMSSATSNVAALPAA